MLNEVKHLKKKQLHPCHAERSEASQKKALHPVMLNEVKHLANIQMSRMRST